MVTALWAAVRVKLDAETDTGIATVFVKPPLVAVKERLKVVAAMLMGVVT